MVNENIKLIVENKKPIETVQEVNNEIPSYEEFLKNYNKNKEIVDSYENEFDSYGDIRIKGTYYGPGFWSDFWDDIKVVVKPVASGVLVVASVFPPTAPIAATAAFGVIGTGAATMGLGHVIDNKDLKNFGRDIVEIGAGAHEGHELTESPMGVGQPSLNQYARSRK